MKARIPVKLKREAMAEINRLTDSEIMWALTFFKDNVQIKLQKEFKEMFPTKSSYLEPKVVSFDW